jgi:hypothetical protein
LDCLAQVGRHVEINGDDGDPQFIYRDERRGRRERYSDNFRQMP